MSIRLLALDLDGTLTANGASDIPRENIEAIREAQARGVFVTIATGRSGMATEAFWRMLNIQGPAIQFGGACVMDTRSREILFQQAVEPELAAEILAYAQDVIGVRTQLYDGETLISEQVNPEYAAITRNHPIPTVIDPQMREKRYHHIMKLMALSSEEQEPVTRRRLQERFAGRADVSRSQATFTEITAYGVNKGVALRFIAEKLNVRRDEVAAIGDAYLDLPMIEWAGTGACVADGVADVRQRSDVIIPPCMECGVADFIRRYVL